MQSETSATEKVGLAGCCPEQVVFRSKAQAGERHHDHAPKSRVRYVSRAQRSQQIHFR